MGRMNAGLLRIFPVIACLFVVAAGIPAVGAAHPDQAIEHSEQATEHEMRADAHVNNQQSTSPNISVTVAGTQLPAGGELTTTNNPQLHLDVAGDAPIEIISIRIDGETRRSYVPNASSFTEQTTLNLDSGTHELSIVVRTTAGTTTYSATVIEDSAAPLLTFESPISAGFIGENGSYEQLNNSYTLNRSSVELNAKIHDQSEVSRVIIEQRYSYQYGGSPEDSTTLIEITEPNDTISQQLRFGPVQPDVGSGVNTLRIELRDEYGHIREYETQIRVEDDAPPNISVLEHHPVATRSAVRINATAQDRVGLASVGYRAGPENGSGQQYLYTERQPTKQAVSRVVTPTVEVLDGTKNITLIATDHAGNTAMQETSVNYTELVTPKIRFNQSRSGSVGPRTIQAAGEVYDGQISRVRVETLTPDGDTIDINSVYSGGVTEAVSFEEHLDAESYPAAVRVRVLDTTGTEHTKTIELSQSEPIDDPAQQERTETATVDSVASPDPISPVPSQSGSLPQRVLSFISQHALAIALLISLLIAIFGFQQRQR